MNIKRVHAYVFIFKLNLVVGFKQLDIAANFGSFQTH